jgi:hypothetical protein
MGNPEKRRLSASAGIILFILLLCTAHIALADGEEVITEINSTYTLVPEDGIVKVSKEITFHNNDSKTRYWRGYYSSFNHYLPDNALKVEAFDSERALIFSRTSEGYHTFHFNRKVWYEESYTFRIEYELETNKNTAVFSLSEYGQRTEVILEVPAGFDTYLSRDDYEVEERMYSSVYKFEKGQRWDRSCVVNSVRVSPRLTLKGTAVLSERDVDVQIRYWEGEEAWAQGVMQTTLESLVLLEEKWGFAYPPEYNITITQANITETGGYGGYNQGSSGIWLLYTSNHGILIHELAHYWTRACNFDQLWMEEGYADLYTYLVLEEMEPEEGISRRDRFLGKYDTMKEEYDFPLSDWSTPASLDGFNEKQVDFGYKKSFALTYSIYETMGLETLQDMNQQFLALQSDIDNADYLNIADSVSDRDISFIEMYLYA